MKTATRKRTSSSNGNGSVDVHARPALRTTLAIQGAREHNLKNISLQVPRDQFVVVTGLSGSGKSSLAFDTIYAEGQRRYMESLSSYARRFVQQVAKPDEEKLEPIDVSIEPLTTTRVCLVAGGDALVDSQVLAVGATEEYSGEKSYRLDLVGGGTVRMKAGGEEKKLEADGDASFEADQDGIREIDYAGPDCP